VSSSKDTFQLTVKRALKEQWVITAIKFKFENIKFCNRLAVVLVAAGSFKEGRKFVPKSKLPQLL